MLRVNKVDTGIAGLTLDELKMWVKVDYNDDDEVLSNLIRQSRGLLENYLNISMVDSSITLLMDSRTDIRLPYGPADTIVSVKDEDGNDLNYKHDGLLLRIDPATIDCTITVVYTTLDNTNTGLKLGWMEVAAYLYENRGDVVQFINLLVQNQNLMPYRNKVWI